MRRTATTSLIVTLALILALVAGCGKDEANNNNNPPANNSGSSNGEQGELKDGLYYAEGDYAESSGWKEIVAIKVEGGKIVAANWNGLHKDGGLDKKTSSEKGYYGMKANGKAQAEWHEQAAAAEKYLLDNQSLDGVKLDGEGKTDAISGVSIHVNGFTELVAKALAAGPITAAGPYKDGHYYAEAADFDANSGWKETVDIAVINGRIVAVSWNGLHKDGGTDKVARSKAGEYGMAEKGNAQAEWHEQALKVEQELLAKQDPAQIPFNEADGKTDAISGVSIHVNSFVELAGKALAGAK